MKGVREKDGPVLLIDGMSWNDMIAMAEVDADTMEFYDTPLYDTPSANDVKIGYFDNVYRKGMVVFPVEPFIGMDGEPIILTKGNDE